MSINKSAPVVGAGEVEIAADRETTWQVMADVPRWPTWNPDIKEASLLGGLAEGEQFRWKVQVGTITSTFTHVERPTLLAWIGKGFGVDAIHVWRLDPGGPPGTTRVRTEESWDGLLARILRRPFRKALQDSIDSGLMHLKTEAERRVSGGV